VFVVGCTVGPGGVGGGGSGVVGVAGNQQRLNEEKEGRVGGGR